TCALPIYKRVVLAHHGFRNVRGDTVAALNLVITAPGFIEAVVIFGVDDFDVLAGDQAQAELLDAHLDDRRAAHQDGLRDLFVDDHLDSTQHALIFAVGVNDAFGRVFGLHEQRAHELTRVVDQAHELLTVSFDVFEGTPGHPGIHGGLGHRRSDLDDQTWVEG